MAMSKLICNMDSELMKQVDAFAASLHITRTAAVSVLISEALQAKKTMNTLESLLQAYQEQKQNETKV